MQFEPTTTSPRTRSNLTRRAMLMCVAALMAYACLAWLSVRTKSPTYDEPLHAVGAWMHLHRMDFRVNPEDPPLWHYWAALPNGPAALEPEAHRDTLAEVGHDVFLEWKFVFEALYKTPGVDALQFIARSRAMMLIVGIALGATLIYWSWKLAGPIAGAAAAMLYCFDPNFLGHGPLVKNDVSMTLATLALTIALWHAGRRLTAWNVLAITLLCAAGVLVKFSALLLGPIAAFLLIIRARLPEPWMSFNKTISSRGQKLTISLSICVLSALVTWFGVWAAYGFRYQPTSEANVGLNTSMLVAQVATNQMSAKTPDQKPSPDEMRAWRPDTFLSGVLFAEQHRLLPQAYTNGLVYTYQSTFYHNAFLLGEHSWVGWWYYFPVALVLKSSLSLWIAILMTVVIAIVARAASPCSISGSSARAGSPCHITMPRIDLWSILCLTIPPAIYLLSAIRTNLNIGARHAFPVLPFVFIGIAIACAYAWQRWGRQAQLVAVVLALGFMTEALAAFPNYIAFFNAALGGPRGGIRLLGDSNLDWGQDLPALARWQREHPDRKLYLFYFGTGEPGAYGIDSRPFPPLPKNERAVLAISATMLQGTYLNDEYAPLKPYFEQIRATCPIIDVLGGTIYLFDYDPARIYR